MSDVVIREMETLEELSRCVELQEEVWGAGFSQRVPVSLLEVSSRLGGVVAGAFEPPGELVGFVFGLTGWEDGRPVHWSDMLAVRPGWRGRRIGTRLKAHQRDRCLERGIDRMYWTFDPLEAGNAHLNLALLGAVAREYVPEMYGESDSPLHRGIGTDRLVALWPIRRERVEVRLRRALGEAEVEAEAEDDALHRPPSLDDLAGVPMAFAVEEREDLPRPGSLEEVSLRGPGVLVPVPSRIQELKAAAPEVAVAWRSAVRQALVTGLEAGLEVREMIRGEGPVSHYLLRASSPR